ncbi:protein TusB [Pseudomonas sp. FH4]|jgi:tRNA 2-thiouridine synthesizing protein B|uniref:Sulfurtransferase complex subunit TusB n=1 Tax=Pseudomonas brenneri TaxID=129817 RepID=A0A5B2UVS1_9PSED|nr:MULTISPECIES: sulfurtransferase complex subunit TusB [Pseudomonas]KAA6174979.1 sulfurtransferase complex subunit TusB [Pseudomonas marginalis]ETK20575.1 protein TusB [Pseudomonas sp. FH4]KAA2230572.1 sulfurtransferase complex subunit TusB [Pseudomonas brenneri]MBF8006869.1 sulfurtransferase complex subunit TusB [Pseudomonas brenneri]MBT9300165.1 sulfurtransferase complex subunit TusB [Pseudomonas sp. TAE6080]|tara:strand:+ start:39 stop:332 length:294 start_codon:yes stop_codon:yes gene_type:complete
MSTLHVLSHSPFTDSRLGSCLRLCGAQDAVLLCGDATYALQAGSAPFQALQAKALDVFVLAEDAQARGLSLPDWAKSVDYPGFVQLSIDHDKVNTWL